MIKMNYKDYQFNLIMIIIYARLLLKEKHKMERRVKSGKNKKNFIYNPFLLLASYCFVKGSDKFNEWFKSTNIYKKHLEGFVKSKAMTLKQKITILLFADIMLMFPIILIDSIHMRIFLLSLMLVKFYYFMFRIKTINPNKKEIKGIS